ncbi:lipocalin family protein [Christiangramia sabulilitoris]|uniref:Lipocalin family protein n=1 Tax=Christiangramia sabulilitoris TaxID=2583991 RepID=A0A550I934_9FLAO|nr:lipocalin family protein [Christiangramia sabulilitoris]TRO67456.1 lipocalin family protein [Christiangramia sabulilitoris]
MKYRLFFLQLAFTFISCSDSQKPFHLPDNANQLLHGDSTKTWKIARRYNDDIRMNMGPCFMAYRQTFKVDHLVQDNNEDTRDCGPNLTGKWNFKKGPEGNSFIKISSPDIPKLLNTEKDYKYFKVLKLTEDTLKISFKHKQYGDTYRRITDILVREDLDIGDRYFHH